MKEIVSVKFIICFLCIEIMWFFSFMLLMWCITLTDVHKLNHPCILNVNSTWFMWMVLLICCWLWFAGLFFFLVALGLSCSMRDLFSCLMWDLVPWPGIKPRPSALGAQSYPLDHQGSSGLLVFYWQFLHRYWSKYWPVVFWYCLSFCFGIRVMLAS